MSDIHLDKHYVDPRLVELYDIENPRGADTDFYLQLADQLEAKTILDLGCGTGLLTRELAATNGRTVFGVDPASAMLAIAQKQPGSENVHWIEGSAADLGEKNADLTIMTGNVAQVFLEEADWAATLTDIYAALRPGGKLAFESRNPKAKAWETWTPENTFQRLESPFGPIESWLEVIDSSKGQVHFKAINRFIKSDEEIIVDSRLRFRSQEEITQSLLDARFSVEHVYGNWQSEPIEPLSRAMIFVAKRQ